MSLSRITKVLITSKIQSSSINASKNLITTGSGAYLPKPFKHQFGMTGAAGTVTAGLLLGALVSKNIASFLEENELFVPADDDDDE